MEADGDLHLRRLPVAQLRARLPLCVRALLTLMRVLPVHAAADQRRLRETLDTLLSRCLPPAPDEEPHSVDAQASAPAEPMDTSTRTAQVCACERAVLFDAVFRASVGYLNELLRQADGRSSAAPSGNSAPAEARSSAAPSGASMPGAQVSALS